MIRDYSGKVAKVTILNLREDLELMGIASEKAKWLARYIIEPRREPSLIVDEKRWQTLK